MIATAGLLLGLSLLGCRAAGGGNRADANAAAPAAPIVAPVAVSVDHLPGGPLTGGGAAAAAPQVLADARTWRVATRWTAVRADDAPPMPPLGARARLVTATRVDLPVLASTRLTRDARIIDEVASESPTPPPGIPVAELAAAAVQGATVSFRTPQPDAPSPDAAGPRGLELQLYAPPGGDADANWSLSVVMTGTVADPTPPDDEHDDQDESGRSGRRAAAGRAGSPAGFALVPGAALQRETAIVDHIAPPAAGQSRVVKLLVPYHFDRSDPSPAAARRGAPSPDALLVELKIEAPDAGNLPPDLEVLSAQARENLARAGGVGAAAASGASPAERATRALLDSVVPSLQDPRQQRRALSFLASQTQAQIFLDAALVADDSTLARLAKAVTDQAAAAELPATQARWGLALDLVALRVLGEMQSAGNVPEEQRSVLLRHAGEAGRTAGAIEDLLVAGAVATRADLESRLVAENLIALEDGSPAVRVRAFDWLALRGRAPAEFDPLGAPRARRDALEKALAAPAPATDPTVTPPTPSTR